MICGDFFHQKSPQDGGDYNMTCRSYQPAGAEVCLAKPSRIASRFRQYMMSVMGISCGQRDVQE